MNNDLMMDKLNEELEELREENRELKERLMRYEETGIPLENIRRVLWINNPRCRTAISTAFNTLSKSGYTTIEELQNFTVMDLVNIHGMGTRSVALVVAVLEHYCISITTGNVDEKRKSEKFFDEELIRRRVTREFKALKF